MFCATDDVIEALSVPNVSAQSHDTIELMRAERFPRVENPAQLMFADRSYDSVYMVWHHHKFSEITSRSVKVQKADFHNGFAVWPCKNTATVTRIEPTIYDLREAFIVFSLLTVSVGFRV
jgi:hypothetical protein